MIGGNLSSDLQPIHDGCGPPPKVRDGPLPNAGIIPAAAWQFSLSTVNFLVCINSPDLLCLSSMSVRFISLVAVLVF
jgi:hypothetical protein